VQVQDARRNVFWSQTLRWMIKMPDPLNLLRLSHDETEGIFVAPRAPGGVVLV